MLNLRDLARVALVTTTATGCVTASAASAHVTPAASYRNLVHQPAPAAVRAACAISQGRSGARRLVDLSHMGSAVGAGAAGRSARSVRAVARFTRTMSQKHSLHTPCIAVGGGSPTTVHSPTPLGHGAARLLMPVSLSPSSHTGLRRLRLTGLRGSGRVTASDPVNGGSVPVRVVSRSLTALVISLRLTDYPRVVTVNQALPASGVQTPGLPNPITTPLSGTPFSSASPWETPLPANVPLDPHSAAIVQNLAGQVHTYYGHAALNTYEYSAPIYTVSATQPTVNMRLYNCQGKSWVDPRFASTLAAVPVPRTAVPSMGSDAEMVIYQPSTDTEWEFWKATQNPSTGGWSACWGGKITGVSHNLGIFAPGLGATASGLPLLGFLIRVRELQSGAIDHALNLEVVHTRAYSYSWPANRTDGNTNDPTAPAEGERFRLNPNIDLTALNLSPGALMVARAMQKYGLIVTDSSGAVAVQGEDPRPYELKGAPDPYGAFFPGHQYSWLQQIPWQDMQAVAWNYGEPRSR